MSDGYRWEVNSVGVVFEVDRLRRERHELIGELGVKCSLPGANVVNGYLLTGDFNFSSVQARSTRAKLLAERARSNGKIDWMSLLEEFCQNVLGGEREGSPSVDLRTLPRPVRDDDFYVEGLAFPRRHPAILFGDGGSAKSYTALYIAGQLVLAGHRVALFDWELAGEDHRDRLEKLFGEHMPEIQYCRCDRPLVHESDRLRKVVRTHKIDYAVYDSIAFACDGRPEDAEIAGKYFRATREIECGSLHIAHVNRSEENDRKPFGSSFWHNGARSTWFVQSSEPEMDGTVRLGFFNRKANLGALRQPASFQVTFGSDRTWFKRAEVADDPELAMRMSIRQRMLALLRRGSMPVQEIADTLEESADTIRRTANRGRETFVLLDGGRIGIKERFA